MTEESPLLFFQGQNIPASKWKNSVRGAGNQQNHPELHVGQHPDAVVYGGLQDEEQLGEHFSQRNGPKGRPYVRSQLDRRAGVGVSFHPIFCAPSLKFRPINREMSVAKRGGAHISWSAHGSEGGKRTSTPSTTFPSAGAVVVVSVVVALRRVLSPSKTISVVRGNGTQILARVVDGKGVKVPRSLIDEGGEYQLNVTAGNHFGSSQSDPVSFCLEDMGAIHHFTVP